MAAKQKKQDRLAGAADKTQAPAKAPTPVKAQGQAKTQAAAAVAASQPGGSKFGRLIRYFEDARTELGKVSWPTRKEVKVTSIAVLILVVIMSIFLGLMDLLLAKIMELILSRGM
ncbi:preprotein translocase subunit SecE [Desulfovibrio sp. OttesenSCG-928-A18]|nr:preprotein translocase subunit SecE [Desulfovibrio sp. OttesenSCG-928-A18]